jgi:hypothetical protein
MKKEIFGYVFFYALGLYSKERIKTIALSLASDEIRSISMMRMNRFLPFSFFLEA